MSETRKQLRNDNTKIKNIKYTLTNHRNVYIRLSGLANLNLGYPLKASPKLE